MNEQTVEYKHATKRFVQEVLTDGRTYTAKLTNTVSGATYTVPGWHSYRAALETVQDMYDDQCRRF